MKNDFYNKNKKFNKKELEEIIEDAYRLYQEDKNNFSKDILNETASELDIPQEYIDQAIYKRQSLKIKKKKNPIKYIIIISAIILFIALILFFLFYNQSVEQNVIHRNEQIKNNNYNIIVELDENVKSRWAQLENVIQRKMDLIPMLTKIAREYTEHEKDAIKNIVNAKNNFLKSKNLKSKMNAYHEFDALFNDYLKENQPKIDLKSDKLYQSLMFEIAGSENRISVERKRYNKSVEKYNNYVRKYPINQYIKSMGFDKRKPYFRINKK